MELNTNIKIVYSDNNETKVLRGLLIEEDEFTFTIKLDNSKIVTIGKRALIKATPDDKVSNNG